MKTTSLVKIMYDFKRALDDCVIESEAKLHDKYHNAAEHDESYKQDNDYHEYLLTVGGNHALSQLIQIYESQADQSCESDQLN